MIPKPLAYLYPKSLRVFQAASPANLPGRGSGFVRFLSVQVFLVRLK